jgi:hypothetical protein
MIARVKVQSKDAMQVHLQTCNDSLLPFSAESVVPYGFLGYLRNNFSLAREVIELRLVERKE